MKKISPESGPSASSTPTVFSLKGTAAQDRVLERPSGWRRHRSIWLVLAASVIGVGLSGTFLFHLIGANGSVDRSRLTIATVRRARFIRDVAAEGQVVAKVSPTLYAPTAGTVTLRVHPGDAVDKDQLLAVLDSPDLTAKTSQEESTLQSLQIEWKRAKLEANRRLSSLEDLYRQAQVDRKTAQREFERSRKAYELGSYSELQTLRAADAFEKAKFSEDQARKNFAEQPAQNRFDIDSRKAQLDRQQYLVTDLQRQVATLDVRSPVSGQVGTVQISDRASVAKDIPLLTVVDLSTLEVEIKMPESQARDLVPGMPADLDGNGQHWKGIISGVSPEVVNGDVVTRLRFSDGKPIGLRQGQRLSVRITIDERDHVLIVDRGRFADQDGGFAYVVRGDIAERRPVHLGAISVQNVEIIDGLEPGDQVVVSGAEAFNGAARVILSH